MQLINRLSLRFSLKIALSILTISQLSLNSLANENNSSSKSSQIQSNISVSESKAQNDYLLKIEQFKQITDYQLDRFFQSLQPVFNHEPAISDYLKKSLSRQKSILTLEVNKLKELYIQIFIVKKSTKIDRTTLVDKEARLSIAIHQQLSLLHQYIVEHQQLTNVNTSDLIIYVKKFDLITDALEKNLPIEVDKKMGIEQVFQSGHNIINNICKMAFGLCLRQTMSELLDSLNESDFLLEDKFEYININPAKKILDKSKKSVFILIGNHDQPLLDIALARKVALQLGSEKHISMTRKSVYPIPPSNHAGDVVFVIDNDPKSNPVQESIEQLSKAIINENHNRVSLAVYPEGMLPYTGGQMPMTVKEGAFVIARKLAIVLETKGIPVYLVRMKTNIIDHLTSPSKVAPIVKMETVSLVPTDVLSKDVPDQWIYSQRFSAEKSFNSHRGVTQLDILSLDNPEGSRIPYALEKKACSRVFLFTF